MEYNRTRNMHSSIYWNIFALINNIKSWAKDFL